MSTAAVTRRDAILERALSLRRTDLANFLDAACAEDSILRREVERLLHLHAQMGTWSLAPSGANGKPPFAPGKWLGRYELQAVLGCGGMGLVYRAFDPVIGRKVAVKVLAHGSDRTERQTAHFLSELRMLGSVVHDNVVRVYDYGEVDNIRYLVMELLEGEDLGRAIANGHCGNVARKFEIMRQVAKALEHIHALGIVHRDLKPANVFLESSGRVKLMDFGIAGCTDALGDESGEVIGTPQYMAPEQLRGLPGSRSVDIYAFGVVLFEVLTGHRPFSGNSIQELSSNITAAPIPIRSLLDSGAPISVIELICRATNKNPMERPQSFAEILEVLAQAMVGDATPVAGRRRSRPSLMVAATIALLSSIGVGPHAKRAPAIGGVMAEAAGAVLPSAATVEIPAAFLPASGSLKATAHVSEPLRGKPHGDAAANVPHSSYRGAEPDVRASGSDSSFPQAFDVPAAASARTDEAIEGRRLAEARPRELAVSLEWDRLQRSEDPPALRAFAAKYSESAEGDAASRLARELDARDQARREIIALLERYAAANRNKDVHALATIWPGLSGDRLRTIAASFAHIEKFEFTLEADRAPEFSEPAAHSAYASASYHGDAVVACRRRVQIVDRSGVRPTPSETRIAIRLTRADNKWTIASIE